MEEVQVNSTNAKIKSSKGISYGTESCGFTKGRLCDHSELGVIDATQTVDTLNSLGSGDAERPMGG
jgi:hypothetical protein